MREPVKAFSASRMPLSMLVCRGFVIAQRVGRAVEFLQGQTARGEQRHERRLFLRISFRKRDVFAGGALEVLLAFGEAAKLKPRRCRHALSAGV